MNSPDFPVPPPPPEEFWEDLEWANTHMNKISAAYPDQWVAIVDRRVVAGGPILADVESRAMALTGRTEFPVLFAETGIRVYAHRATLPFLIGFEDILTRATLHCEYAAGLAYLDI